MIGPRDTPPGNHNDFVGGIYDGRHLVDALHPNGRCTCWGENRCAYCKMVDGDDPGPGDGGGEPLPASDEEQAA